MIFSRVRMCPLYIENIAEKMLFSLKNGIPRDDQFERFACSVDNSNFSATVGWPQSTLRIGVIKLAWEGWAGAFVLKFGFALNLLQRSLRHLLEPQNDLNRPHYKTETWFQKSPPTRELIPFQSTTCFDSDCVVSPCLLCFLLHSFFTDPFVVLGTPYWQPLA